MPSPAITITSLLARRGGRRGLQAHALSLAAASTGAALLLVLVAFFFGVGQRADRTAWLTPRASSEADAAMVQIRSVMATTGGNIIVVDLATLPGKKATATPPGLPAFPSPGQVFVSPHLLNLMRDLPARQLADRFGTVSGTIGAAGLSAPDQLLAVVGHSSADPAVSVAAAGSGLDGTVRAVVANFDGAGPDALTAADRTAVILAFGLVLMPIIVLTGASGRLGASRREQRLAALRLAGATPRQILAMAGFEAFALGCVGAVLGVALCGASLPLLAMFRLGIGSWYAADLWVGLPLCFAMILLVALMSAISAVTTLARVIGDPLGVARHVQPRRARLIRLLTGTGALGYVFITARGGDLQPRQIAALAVVVYGAFWIAGPWVVGRIGSLTARLARRPAMLLAGRRLIEDPHAAWRTVSGLVLAGLLAGFVSIAQLGIAIQTDRNHIGLSTEGTKLSTVALTASAERVLAQAGIADAEIRAANDNDFAVVNGAGIIVTVAGSQRAFDTAVTALSSLPLATRPAISANADAGDELAFDEFAAVCLASLGLGFVIAVVSSLLSSTADVLDRRQTYTLLRRAGAPVRVLNRARSWQTALPLLALAGGTTGLGVYAAYRLNAALHATVNVGNAAALIGCLSLGTLAMMLTLLASRRLLIRMTENEGERSE